MKWLYAILATVCIVFVAWLVKYVSTPPPGTKIEDLGREHVSAAEVEKTAYNSNPPTSGPHMVTWVKPGVYDQPQHDGELIHSLEHGYIVISYNCSAHPGTSSKYQNSNSKQISKFKFQTKVYAHEEDATVSAEPFVPGVATGSAIIDTDSCKKLQTELKDLAERKRLFKLVVVPRPSLDSTIALTAWNYIDKFDNFDAGRIERFIDYHRDHGPEATME